MTFVIILVLFFCGTAMGQEEESIEELYQSSIVAYHQEEWMKSIKLMEMALVHYKMLQHMDITCRTKCSSTNATEELEQDFTGFAEMEAYANLVVQAQCINSCRQEHPYGNKGIVYPRKKSQIDFEEGTPYNFLQYAYYRTVQIRKACQAAWTFLQKHPNHEAMRKNVDFYSGLPDVEDDFFKDIEQLPYVELYTDGATAYTNKDFDQTIEKLEEFLEQYYKAYADCGNLCYKSIAPAHMLRLHEATACRFGNTIECMLQCEKRLMPTINGNKISKILPKAYGYLQYAYFQTSQWKMCIASASSEFLLDPDGEIAKSNIEFYKNFVKENSLEHIPFNARPDAIQHFTSENNMRSLLKEISELQNYNDEDDVIDEINTADIQSIFQSKEIMKEIALQISTTISENMKGELS